MEETAHLHNLLVPMAFSLVTLPAASVRKEMATDLSTGSHCRDIRGHGTLPYSHLCCSPYTWWYTISKTSLKYCQGEPVKVLSYLKLPQPIRWVWKLCLSNWGLGLHSFWYVCYLLHSLQLSAALKSTVHWREAVPLRLRTSVQAEESHSGPQISLFKPSPLHFSTPYTTHALIQPIWYVRVPNGLCCACWDTRFPVN